MSAMRGLRDDMGSTSSWTARDTVRRRAGSWPAPTRSSRLTCLTTCGAALLAACTTGSTLQNVAGPAAPSVVITPEQPIGWIGLAPRPSRDAGDWVPAGAPSLVVPMPAAGLTTGTTLPAIDSRGRVEHVTAGAPAKLPYGCDNQQLDVLTFTGERFAPGVVWLLPPAAPATWRPTALAIVSPVAATPTRRRDTVGPLSLELTRSDATHATLAIARGGRVVHTAEIERPAMDGADLGPLDLQHPGIAIPEPVAAWSVADGGPILLVLEVPSYEGVQLTPFLIESDHARALPAMATYLYQCAF